eukprot:scaffold118443_cov67-Phaeocystis_antarctica.AAC.2
MQACKRRSPARWWPHRRPHAVRGARLRALELSRAVARWRVAAVNCDDPFTTAPYAAGRNGTRWAGEV